MQNTISLDYAKRRYRQLKAKGIWVTFALTGGKQIVLVLRTNKGDQWVQGNEYDISLQINKVQANKRRAESFLFASDKLIEYKGQFARNQTKENLLELIDAFCSFRNNQETRPELDKELESLFQWAKITHKHGHIASYKGYIRKNEVGQLRPYIGKLGIGFKHLLGKWRGSNHYAKFEYILLQGLED